MSQNRFRFAIQTGPFNDPVALRAYAQKVERLGYDELFSYDHVCLRDNAAVDPFIPLIVAAEATTTLRVGPLVLNNEFHNPALMARTAISVDQMTSGRLTLGMGTGYDQSEHDAIDVPLRPPGERVSRFGESLQILRDLFDQGTCTFAGEHHNIAVDEFGLSPVQASIPFLIGGHGRRVVSLAGRFADIFQFTGLTHGPDGSPSAGGFAPSDIAKRAQWLADAAGDRNQAIERSALVQITALDSDGPSEDDLVERLSQPAEVVRDTPFVLVGSLEQVVDKIERLREDFGISHFVVRDVEGFAPVVDALKDQ